MNYHKWDKIIDDFDSDSDDNSDTRNISNLLLHYKQEASDIFDKAIDSNDCKLYEKALTCYQEIIRLEKQNNQRILHLPCELNIICCLFQLKRYHEVISRCDDLKTNNFDVGVVDVLRIKYFKINSLISLSTTESLHLLITETSDMKDLLRNSEHLVSAEHQRDYHDLFNKINTMLPENGNISDINYESQNMKYMLSQYDTGRSYLANKNFIDAYNYFLDNISKVSRVPIKSHDMHSNINYILSVLLENQAKAADAYSQAYYHRKLSLRSNTDDSLRLCLNSGLLFHSIQEYSKAIDCYDDIINSLNGFNDEKLHSTNAISHTSVILLATAHSERANSLSALGTHSDAVIESCNIAVDILIGLLDCGQQAVDRTVRDKCYKKLILSLQTLIDVLISESQIKNAIFHVNKLIEYIKIALSDPLDSNLDDSVAEGTSSIDDTTYSVDKTHSHTAYLSHLGMSLMTKGNLLTQSFKLDTSSNSSQELRLAISSSYHEAADTYLNCKDIFIQSNSSVSEQSSFMNALVIYYDKIISCYALAAEVWYDAASITPYQTEEVNFTTINRENKAVITGVSAVREIFSSQQELIDSCERSFDNWKLVSKHSLRVICDLDKYINEQKDCSNSWLVKAKSMTTKFQYNHMIAMYYAGLSALRYDLSVAQRSFESCNDYISSNSINYTLDSNLDAVNLTESGLNSSIPCDEVVPDDALIYVLPLNRVQTLNAGVCYHLTHCYLRQSRNSEALEEVCKCIRLCKLGFECEQSLESSNYRVSYLLPSLSYELHLDHLTKAILMKVLALISVRRLGDVNESIYQELASKALPGPCSGLDDVVKDLRHSVEKIMEVHKPPVHPKLETHIRRTTEVSSFNEVTSEVSSGKLSYIEQCLTTTYDCIAAYEIYYKAYLSKIRSKLDFNLVLAYLIISTVLLVALAVIATYIKELQGLVNNENEDL